MQAQTSPRQTSSLLAWVIACFGVILMALLFLSFIADTRPVPANTATAAQSVAYLQFGLDADTLWLADPANAGAARAVLVVPHGPEYGILPAISPDGALFAYTALPPDLSHPKPDSPGGLWLVDVDGSQRPRLLVEDVDLLVAPVWSPDGGSLVYRRSFGGANVLAISDLDGAEERILAYSEAEALFPIAFAPDGDRLYLAGLNEHRGSYLYKVNLSSGLQSEVAPLSEGLTRDWALSPDGTQLVFLQVAFSEVELASRAFVLVIASGDVRPLTAADEVAFGPLWSANGELTVGLFDPGSGQASLLIVGGNTRSRISGPESGFDVPLAHNSAAGAYLVRSFENDSITAPGRSRLVLVNADGHRKTIAEGEVTLVGWTAP